MTRPRTQPADKPEPRPRMRLSDVVERLTEKRGGVSSVTMKMSAQGVFMPDVTIAAHEDDAVIDKMIEQATRAFTGLHEAARDNAGGSGGENGG